MEYNGADLSSISTPYSTGSSIHTPTEEEEDESFLESVGTTIIVMKITGAVMCFADSRGAFFKDENETHLVGVDTRVKAKLIGGFPILALVSGVSGDTTRLVEIITTTLEGDHRLERTWNEILMAPLQNFTRNYVSMHKHRNDLNAQIILVDGRASTDWTKVITVLKFKKALVEINEENHSYALGGGGAPLAWFKMMKERLDIVSNHSSITEEEVKKIVEIGMKHTMKNNISSAGGWAGVFKLSETPRKWTLEDPIFLGHVKRGPANIGTLANPKNGTVAIKEGRPDFESVLQALLTPTPALSPKSAPEK